MDPYVQLAKQAAEEYVKNNTTLEVPDDLPDELTQEHAGVFVTVKLNGELRGCIGTVASSKVSVANEIISNAISAVARDFRFQPVTKEELPHIQYEVSILHPLTPVKDLTSVDPETQGIVVRAQDGRSGLLLPGLEGIATPEQQFKTACQKAGIRPGIDKKIRVLSFTTEKHI